MPLPLPPLLLSLFLLCHPPFSLPSMLCLFLSSFYATPPFSLPSMLCLFLSSFCAIPLSPSFSLPSMPPQFLSSFYAMSLSLFLLCHPLSLFLLCYVSFSLPSVPSPFLILSLFLLCHPNFSLPSMLCLFLSSFCATPFLSSFYAMSLSLFLLCHPPFSFFLSSFYATPISLFLLCHPNFSLPSMLCLFLSSFCATPLSLFLLCYVSFSLPSVPPPFLSSFFATSFSLLCPRGWEVRWHRSDKRWVEGEKGGGGGAFLLLSIFYLIDVTVPLILLSFYPPPPPASPTVLLWHKTTYTAADKCTTGVVLGKMSGFLFWNCFLWNFLFLSCSVSLVFFVFKVCRQLLYLHDLPCVCVRTVAVYPRISIDFQKFQCLEAAWKLWSAFHHGHVTTWCTISCYGKPQTDITIQRLIL